MTGIAHVPVDQFACDLCSRYRPHQPRACGVDFVDGFWACVVCYAAYRAGLAAGGRRERASASAVRT